MWPLLASRTDGEGLGLRRRSGSLAKEKRTGWEMRPVPGVFESITGSVGLMMGRNLLFSGELVFHYARETDAFIGRQRLFVHHLQ